MTADFLESLKSRAWDLPDSPGVYRFTDNTQQVLYVGKAKNLKKRVTSYFSGSHTRRIQAMLYQAVDVDMTVTATENEALILEANLIKRFKPPYNVLLKDDKSHPYLHLTLGHPYPKLSLYRGNRKEAGRFFGPYPSVHAVRETLHWLQKIFPVRQCRDTQFANRSRPCLQYQIKRCSGPCCGRVSADCYGQWIKELTLFLEGKDRLLEKSLKNTMWEASQQLNFEEAALLRDRLAAMVRIQDQRRLNLAQDVDLDVICGAENKGRVAIQIFFVRDGINLGNCNYFPDNVEGIALEEVLAAFISQYYADPTHNTENQLGSRPGWPPAEILIDCAVPDAAWLTAFLTRLRGSSVHLHRPIRGEKRRLLDMARANAEEALVRRGKAQGSYGELLTQLAEILGLEQTPERIEAYDVSHFQDSQPSASLVVFAADGFRKNSYRRYAIKDETLADDTARMAEIMARRFTELKEVGQVAPGDGQGGEWPDLILLDGGLGQLQAALVVAEDMQLDGVAFCAIAKGPDRDAGRERLFLPGRAEPLSLPVHSPVLHLLQNIRDEAHRFAVGFHRVRRQKAQRHSALDDIPGIGAKRKRALLQRFGSVKAIREADCATLATVEGISTEMAQRIGQFFQEESGLAGG